MEVRKAIKHIVALGTGLTMLGATVFGAMAADLGEYPSQYIKDGKFDGLMVVGAKAKSDDILGIVDIATALQFASKVEKKVTGTTVTELSGDVYRFGSSADMLEIGEYLGSVKSTLTSDEMGALASRSITTSAGSTDVDQYLKFNSSAGLRVVYERNKANIVGPYLKSENNENMYTFEVQFPEGLQSATYSSTSSTTKLSLAAVTAYLNDLDEEELYLLGETFSVVEVQIIGTNTEQIKITLMGGALTDTLKEGESRTYEIEGKSYEVSVLIISDSNTGGGSGPKVKFMINGEVTKSLSDGDTETLDDGTVIGIKSLLANEGSEEGGYDVVEFYIGANKIELTDTNYSDSSYNSAGVKIDEENIEDAKVMIGATWSSQEAKISTIKYQLKADSKVSGDLYIEAGDGLRNMLDEPEGMLSSVWDVKYLGLSEPDSSTLAIVPAADETYYLEFTNQEGIEYSVPLVDNSNDKGLQWKLGDDENKLVFVEASCATYNEAIINIDDMFVVSDESKSDNAFTHVLTFDAVDTSDGILTFSDLGDGSTKEVQFTTTADLSTGAATTTDLVVGGESYSVKVFNVGDPSTDEQYYVCVDLDNSGTFEANATVPLTIYGGAILNFYDTLTWDGLMNRSGSFLSNISLNMSLQVLAKYTDNNAAQIFNWTAYTAANNKVDLDYRAQSGIYLGREADKNSDVKKGMTRFGMYVEEDEPDDSSDADSLTITVPAEQVYAQVYVTGGEAAASTSTSGSTVAEYTKIQVGKAVQDIEISNIAADNLIVIGGPCVNTVAAQILGISTAAPACYEDFPVQEGQGIIKMVENGGKVATLVAGYSAADTRKAAQILANSDDYADDLAGKDEVVVSGAKIMAAQVVPE